MGELGWKNLSAIKNSLKHNQFISCVKKNKSSCRGQELNSCAYIHYSVSYKKLQSIFWLKRYCYSFRTTLTFHCCSVHKYLYVPNCFQLFLKHWLNEWMPNAFPQKKSQSVVKTILLRPFSLEGILNWHR